MYWYISLVLCVWASVYVHGGKQCLNGKCEQAGTIYGPGKGEVFTVAVGHDYGGHDYISAEGYVTGFSKDVVRAVCQAAGIQCRMIWDRYPNCWHSTPGEHSYGGKGLMSRWYDGCISWWPTVDRIHVFDFSLPYMRAPLGFFYVRYGTQFDPVNLKNKKLGFMDGWASDEKCVARSLKLGDHLDPSSKVVHLQNIAEAIRKINSRELDAFFVTEETVKKQVDSKLITKITSRSFQCFLAGNSMMTRKDNFLNVHWNRGYQMLRSSGAFAKLCKEGRVEHGSKGPIDCLDG